MVGACSGFVEWINQLVDIKVARREEVDDAQILSGFLCLGDKRDRKSGGESCHFRSYIFISVFIKLIIWL
jgi:hypothetical protein